MLNLNSCNCNNVNARKPLRIIEAVPVPELETIPVPDKEEEKV